MTELMQDIPANIVGMFIANGLKVYLAGLLLGLVLMGIAAPVLAPFLYQTAALSPGIYLLSASVLTLAVLLFIYLPAAQDRRVESRSRTAFRMRTKAA